MSQIPVQTEKLYTAEELSTDKYYKRGENAYKLLEKLEYRESYPNVFSRLYNFECININTGNRYTEEITIYIFFFIKINIQIFLILLKFLSKIRFHNLFYTLRITF
jgi:hypothetical protein